MARLWLRWVGIVVLLGLAGGVLVILQPLWVDDERIRVALWHDHVHSEYAEVDGYKIHYFEAIPTTAAGARGGGRPLLLVHGLGSRGEDWSPMIASLAAQGFHVYAPDLLGYGRSSKPDVGYSISLEEKTVVDFMRAVGLEKADLGGWSMGGWVAMKVAIDHPELVDRLVLFDSAGVYFPPTFDVTLFTPTDSIGLSRLSAMLTPQPKPLAGYVSRAVVRRLQANAWVIERTVNSMEAGRDLLDFQLGAIRSPTLVVWGRQDELIPLSVGEEIHHQIAGSSMLIVDGCGHLAPGECALPVLRGVVDFLAAPRALVGAEQTVVGRAE